MKTEDFVCNGPTQTREAGAHPNDSRGWISAHANGITKRELFAAMAMMGYMSHPQNAGMDASFEVTASDAVGFADALIKQLNKEKK